MPHPEKPHRRPTLKSERETERLSVGGFFAEHRRVIDERKDQLARVGMDPLHVDALRMPDLKEGPLPARGTPVMKLPTKPEEPRG